MEGVFSLLLFAGLFFVMMRFGCGAHMGHGGHAGHDESRQDRAGGHAGHDQHGAMAAGAVDPVCGMEVAAGAGYTRLQGGREYRFCSRACLDKFEASPQKYAA